MCHIGIVLLLLLLLLLLFLFIFFFNDTATTEIYTLSLHDALPICMRVGQRVQRHQADGVTPRERYHGLVCVMADFHCQMEVLAMTWKVLLSMESGCDHGTLYCCRNILNATLTSEPRKEYFKNGSLMDKTTKAYAVLGKCTLYTDLP